MGAMRDIRVRDERTSTMFQPLKETVALLKQYGVPVKDETISQLDDGPVRWKALDKKKKQRTEALNAKVIAEQLEVRRRSDVFQKHVDAFSEHFQAVAPFHVKVRIFRARRSAIAALIQAVVMLVTTAAFQQCTQPERHDSASHACHSDAMPANASVECSTSALQCSLLW